MGYGNFIHFLRVDIAGFWTHTCASEKAHLALLRESRVEETTNASVELRGNPVELVDELVAGHGAGGRSKARLGGLLREEGRGMERRNKN